MQSVNNLLLSRSLGESENEKPASSDQVEELQTQTTNLGLQLRKQMEDNTGTCMFIHTFDLLLFLLMFLLSSCG